MHQRGKSQATLIHSRRLFLSSRPVVLLMACAVAALAFGFPLEQTLARLTPRSALPGKIRESLKLPPADESALLDPNWRPQQPHWRTVTVEQGDTLAGIFDSLDLPSDDLYALLAAGAEAKALATLYPGLVLRLHRADGHLQELVYETAKQGAIRIYRDNGEYKIAHANNMIEQRTAFATGIIDDTFLDAAKQAGLSLALRKHLQQIFAHRIDFTRDIHPHDRFTVIYREHYFGGEKLGDGDILAAELDLSGHRYRAIGFPDKQGRLRYYTPAGKGIEPAFTRYPLHFERVSSPFGAKRLHPILGIVRPHTGIDLAAPRGTPIRAPGDGVIEYRGWEHGYGRTIMIDHGRGYETLYAHMSRYNRKLHDGDRVTKGELIGYVGSTGLATGPHLHYEIRVDGVPRNPATVTLPGDPPLASARMAAFKQKAQPLLAQMALLSNTRVALRGD